MGVVAREALIFFVLFAAQNSQEELLAASHGIESQEFAQCDHLGSRAIVVVIDKAFIFSIEFKTHIVENVENHS